MVNVVYIIGAGASANALPIINTYKDSNGTLHASLIEELLAFTSRIKTSNGYEIYFKLCEESEFFTTPDTFAKFLYVNGRNSDYLRLKVLISAYFFWRERVRTDYEKCFDKRIISFLTTISEINGSFPRNIKIISWNYDAQFIKAFQLSKTQGESRFLTNYKSHPFAIDETVDKINLSLIHLNGIAGYTFDEKSNIISNKFSRPHFVFDDKTLLFENEFNEQEKIKKIIDMFSFPNESILISYAWEQKRESNLDYPYANDRIQYAKALARGADVLVVIGYSFPFFNREVDKLIFKEMPTLKKIYFQDPFLNGNFLHSQFELDRRRVIIEHISDVKNYYVPYEL